MASKAEEEEECKIPVFTVLKNNAILKNIFILNKPPQPSPSKPNEDILLVGRHPDCDIMLTHPSISRFHLHIRSKPSSQSLSLVDLSSVHGTWVSERKLEPGVSVEMNEGDTLRIGASSRVYRLHWIPISCAYDLENPFVSELDVVLKPQNEEQEKVQSLNCYPVEMEEIQSMDSILESISLLFLDENLEVTVEKEIPTAPAMPEDTFSFCCLEERKSPSKDETFGVLSEPFGTETSYLPMTSDWENQLCDSLNQELAVKKEISSAPPMPEGIISLCCEEEMKIQSKDEMFGVPSDLFCTENELRDSPDQVLSLPYMESVVDCDSTLTEYFSESGCLSVAEAVQGAEMQQFYTPTDTFTSPLTPGLEASFEKHCSSLLLNTDPASFDEKSAAEAVIPEESEFGCTDRDDERVADIRTPAARIFNSEKTFLPVEEYVHDTICQHIKVVEEIPVDLLSDGEKQDKGGEEHKPDLRSHLNAKYCHKQGNSLDEIVQDIGNKCTGSICPISLSLQIESANSSTLQEAALKITKENQIPQSDMESLESHRKPLVKTSTIGNIWSRRGKAASAPQIRTSKSAFKTTANVDTEFSMSNEKDITKKTISKDLFPVLDGEEEEEETFTPDKENFSPNTLHLRFLKKKGIIKKTISKDLFPVLDGEEEEEETFTPDKENFSPNTLHLRFLKKKGKLEEIKHSKSKRSNNSKDNFSPDIYLENPKDIINKTISKDLFSALDGEEEIFTPEKENFSPNTLQLRLLKKKGKLEEIKCSQSILSQNSESFSPNIYPDEKISSTSNKENQTLKASQEHKSRRKPFGSHIKTAQEHDITASKNTVERVPFQPLKNTGSKSRSGTSCPVKATISIDVNSCRQILDKPINSCDIIGERKRSWDMVVDTTSLLNKESRKALQLLQGLKGTRLIIPRLVMRELNRVKQQFTIFRRISEASLALDWIEECMVRTNWWIHIQSSMEEETMIAPTPPASPHTQFSSQSLSFHKSSLEIASPTVEDHILDFVLLYRRKQNDGQLVLLSEDVSLKIKCMAEGLLCEPVQEFRESLVNPFSERFLWTNSSPRGQTWSCQDDIVLREKYCSLPKRKSSKASGLKLILLHNSQYRHY